MGVLVSWAARALRLCLCVSRSGIAVVWMHLAARAWRHVHASVVVGCASWMRCRAFGTASRLAGWFCFALRRVDCVRWRFLAPLHLWDGAWWVSGSRSGDAGPIGDVGLGVVLGYLV